MATADFSRLYRSRTDKYLGGVCGGIAETYDVDPTLIRLLVVAATLMGWGLIMYIAAWIVMPVKPITAD
ncbi:PspC domain-containing protein [Corynebacterium caspium]|uniref:PspC domain-containing protein n=1 Tax=Corynebacterium caspium TaxID=234828 RepID=UPI00037BD9AF|nr:PspC domain-containing protein [Corynebacterium caspium]WKD59478.1 DNA-binding transcriptional activator PspC [Corynebacterium caspium DSM 44850]